MEKYNNQNLKTHYTDPTADLRTKDWISELEDRPIEIIQSEEYREQKIGERWIELQKSVGYQGY